MAPFVVIVVALAVVSALSAYLGIAALMAWRVIRPDRTWRPADYLPPAEPYESVRFTAADGVVLDGWFAPAPAPRQGHAGADCVIVCHGIGTNRTEVQDIAAELRRRGHAVLLFDFRAHGASGGRFTTVGLREQEDLLAAVAYLGSRPDVDAERIGVIGMSMGAATAILAASRCDALKWVIADSAFATLKLALDSAFGAFVPVPAPLFTRPVIFFAQAFAGARVADVNPVERIGLIAPRRLLLIHGGSDGLVEARNAALLYAAAREPKELWLLPSCDHVQARCVAPDDYYDRIARFLAQPAAGSPPTAAAARAAAEDRLVAG